MNRSHRLSVASVAMAAAGSLLLAACSSSGGGGSSSGALTASAPGVTAKTITIGSHQPLTGIAAPGYDEIAPASNAYFQYVNAHGGVYGRKIVYKYLNDQYNPSITTTDVRQLILQDHVFAIFNGLGTPTHLAVAPFINAEKVPDLFVASGCACWNQPSTYPETFGWQINYIREGKILGNYIEAHFKGKKIAYFYQDDEFGQDGVKGLGYEIPASQVVAKEPYNVAASNPAAEVGTLTAALKASKAQVVVAFAVPAFMALLRLSELSLGYSPQLVSSDVGSDPITLAGLLNSFAKKNGSFGSSLIQGIITDSYLPSLGSNDSWIKLFSQIHGQYIPKLPMDGNVLYGMSAAYTFVQALFKAGRNPTRQDLVNAVNGGIAQGVSVAPYAYSSTDHDGITGAFIAEVENGALVALGPTQVTDNTATGPVTTDSTPQPAAPTSGIP
jgi:branched-chain amino acid transport system substrate-binding protein